MLKELYTAAMGMLPQQTRLEVIANNLANANTVGYKRESVFERNLVEATNHFNNVPGDAEQDDPPVGSFTDFSAGSFQQTENPFDIALENKNGFFVLQDEAGNLFYSKAGHFNLSTDGTIQAMDGKMLLGTEGPINLQSQFLIDQLNISDTKSVNMKIAENGEMFANDVLVGTVQVATVENPESLERISDSNFIVTKDTLTNYLPQDEVTIRQGWLENSNVNIIKEMVSMIELERMFELGSKVIQTNNETLDKSMLMGRFY